MILLGAVLQLALLLSLAPLVTGVIRRLKANLQMRQGPHVFQPYQDLYKLLRKEMVVPDTASWIFSVTPYVLFGSVATAGLMVPILYTAAPLSTIGGILAIIYLLALGRFFLALGALDSGTPFGGMGSSREMTLSAIAEPAMMLAMFTVAIAAGTTNLSELAGAATGQSWRFLAPSQILAFAALFLVLLAETGRIPVDNPATHLELTMIHEAMILEYSGPYLALIEWGAWVKQLVLMTLLINIFFPFGLSTGWNPLALILSVILYAFKLLALSVAVVLVESTNAKMRFFRVPELLSMAFVLGALALVSSFIF